MLRYHSKLSCNKKDIEISIYIYIYIYINFVLGDLGATIVVAKALCLSIFNLSPTQSHSG